MSWILNDTFGGYEPGDGKEDGVASNPVNVHVAGSVLATSRSQMPVAVPMSAILAMAEGVGMLGWMRKPSVLVVKMCCSSSLRRVNVGVSLTRGGGRGQELPFCSFDHGRECSRAVFLRLRHGTDVWEVRHELVSPTGKELEWCVGEQRLIYRFAGPLMHEAHVRVLIGGSTVLEYFNKHLWIRIPALRPQSQ